MRERERRIHLLPPACALTRDQTHKLGVCPDPGSNLQYFWCMGWRSNQLSYLAEAMGTFFFKIIMPQLYPRPSEWVKTIVFRSEEWSVFIKSTPGDSDATPPPAKNHIVLQTVSSLKAHYVCPSWSPLYLEPSALPDTDVPQIFAEKLNEHMTHNPETSASNSLSLSSHA